MAANSFLDPTVERRIKSSLVGNDEPRSEFCKASPATVNGAPSTDRFA